MSFVLFCFVLKIPKGLMFKVQGVYAAVFLLSQHSEIFKSLRPNFDFNTRFLVSRFGKGSDFTCELPI